MTGYIYYLQEKDSDNIFYVGSSISPTIRKHAHKRGAKDPTTRLYAYMNASILDFSLNIIEEIEIESKGDLVKIESYWINQFKAWGFDLKNSVTYKNKKILYTNPDHNLFPVRLGDLKPLLQQEAFQLEISLHKHILNIISSHVKNNKPEIKKPI